MMSPPAIVDFLDISPLILLNAIYIFIAIVSITNYADLIFLSISYGPTLQFIDHSTSIEIIPGATVH